MKQKQKSFFCLVLGLAWAQAWAGVDCGPRPLRVALYEYGYFYNAGQGIDQDVVQELMRRTGCGMDVQVMTRARIWADLASGGLDMSVSGIQTPERDQFAWFAHYLIMKNYALIPQRLASTVRGPEDFLAQPKLQFGVVRAFKHGVGQDALLAQLRQQQRVQESPDVQTVFKKFQDRRVDALFSQPPVYRKFWQELGLQDTVVIQDWTPHEKGVPHGLIMAKSTFTAKQAEQWREVLQAMRRDGTLLRIFSHYLPAHEAQAMLAF